MDNQTNDKLGDSVWPSVRRKITELKLWDQNPRTISDERFQDLKDSLSEDGDWNVIVIDTDNTVISGNQRIKALLQEGKTEADCKIAPRKLTEEERFRIAARANISAGQFNYDLLASRDVDLLKRAWFDDKDINKILRLKGAEDGFDAGTEAAKTGEVRAKLGNVWLLGRHRLMCGDSTNPAHVAQLMADQKADLVFTDPPYNVAYVDLNHNMRDSAKDWSYCSEWNDEMTDENYAKFLKDFIANAKAVSKEDAHYYIWFAFHYYPELMAALKNSDIRADRVPIIWKKQTVPISWARYKRNYEPCLFAGGSINQPKGTKWFGQNNETSVWEIKTDHNGSYVHPTQKPVTLALKAITNSTKLDDNVLDLFGGSGSTLIACEQSQRACFMMELDPHYADVIITRWEKLTGQKAQPVTAS